MNSSSKKQILSTNSGTKGTKNIIRNFNDLFNKHTKLRNDMLKDRKVSNRNIDLRSKSDIEKQTKLRRTVSKSMDQSRDKVEHVHLQKALLSKASFHQMDRIKRNSMNSEISLKLSALKKLDSLGVKNPKDANKTVKDNILSIYLNDTKNSKNVVFQSNRHIPMSNCDLKADKTINNLNSHKRSSLDKEKKGKYIFQNKLELKNYKIKETLKKGSQRNIDNNFTFNNSIIYPSKMWVN